MRNDSVRVMTSRVNGIKKKKELLAMPRREERLRKRKSVLANIMPTAATSELHSRRKKQAKNTTTNSSSSKQAAAAAAVTTTTKSRRASKDKAPTVIQGYDDEAEEVSLWTTFSSHPLVQVAAVILPIFFLYHAYYFFILQHPEYLQPVLKLRPSVGLTDERQLLIVGTMSSGTTQVAAELSKNLNLEVAHEASDARWYFCRDGTVSWFHGIRFLEPRKPLNRHADKLLRFCTNFTANMGFHPSMYRSTLTCGRNGAAGVAGGMTLAGWTPASTWSPCWAKECFSILSREWGCAARKTTTTSSSLSSCETPFRRVLHQVRHPLRTVESLVTKFCVDGVDGAVNPSFVRFMGSLFDFYDVQDSCIEAATKYVLYYTNALLEARKQGRIFAMYRVEDVSPCQIAALAGLVHEDNDEKESSKFSDLPLTQIFVSRDDIVYEPNLEKLQRICGSRSDAGTATTASTAAAAKEKLSSSKYQINQGQLTLNWVDLQGGLHGSTRPINDTELMVALRKLTMELGYKVDNDAVEDVRLIS
jgi:hypothetical protein